MRVRLILVTVLALLVAGGATATAAPLARYVGYGGPVASLGCAGMTIGGDADTWLRDIDTAAYEDCSFPFGFTVEVTPHLPWQLFPDTTTTYVINDISVDISAPFCDATVTGWAGATYDSTFGLLTVDVQATTANVDPANDCFGLIADGDMFPVLADSYDVVVAV